jgi:hypothetical protein
LIARVNAIHFPTMAISDWAEVTVGLV